jgi:hypothetical protein
MAVGLKCLWVIVDRHCDGPTCLVESQTQTTRSREQIDGKSLTSVATAGTPFGEGLVSAAVRVIVQLQIIAAQQLHTVGGQRLYPSDLD